MKKSYFSQTGWCDYLKEDRYLGNSIYDTIRVGDWLTDPIDDLVNFEKVDFGFVQKEERIYKKAKTHRNCGGKDVIVEYYQDFTSQIDLASYVEFDDRYFAIKGTVCFWWVNSDGHFIVPIDEADPKSFKPFPNICGGVDRIGVYYGCPNFRVNKLNIPVKSNFEFVAKADSYWNSPSHYVIVENVVYDIKYEFDRGYFCEVDKTTSVKDVLKMKKQ